MMGKLYIISRTQEPFKDRSQAGEFWGLQLKKFFGEHAVILGIPRGGLVVAKGIADILDTGLDIVLARKLGARGNPELAMGAITESGEVFLNDSVIDQLGMPEDFTREKECQLATIKQRHLMFRDVHSKIPLEGRTVILTDDGVATGATMEAALWSIQQENPKKIIVALPVGPEETLVRLTKYADEVICLRVPWFLGSISQFYSHFDQVKDEEVLDILREDAEKRHSHA